LASLFKTRQMDTDYILMLKVTDTNLKTMKTKRIPDSFEGSCMVEEK